MARPVKYDRKTALETAMQAMWTAGFSRASVKQLSELLGMTRSSFYNAFGSQEDLLRECLPAYTAQSPDAAFYAERAEGSAVLPLFWEAFRQICRARAADSQGRGCLIVNTVNELCPATDGLGAEFAEMMLGSVKRMERLLEIAQEEGEIEASADPHALALALQNLMVGLNVLCKVVRDEDELWLLTRTTLKGLQLQPPDAAV